MDWNWTSISMWVASQLFVAGAIYGGIRSDMKSMLILISIARDDAKEAKEDAKEVRQQVARILEEEAKFSRNR